MAFLLLFEESFIALSLFRERLVVRCVEFLLVEFMPLEEKLLLEDKLFLFRDGIRIGYSNRFRYLLFFEFLYAFWDVKEA